MRCDFATWLPISNNYRAGGMLPLRGFVPHVQVGDGSLHGFFDNPATQASAHFWCSKTGTLEQYLDTVDMAWAEGAGNPYFISCEFEGQVDEPMTSQQLDMGGRLIAWVYNNVGQFPLAVNEHPDGQGITPHYAGGAAWGGHSCPGPLRFQQYPELILAALRYLEPSPAPEPPEDDTVTVFLATADSSAVYLVGVGLTPRPVHSYNAADTIVTASGYKWGQIPGGGTDLGKDGEGQSRKVWVLDAYGAELFGL